MTNTKPKKKAEAGSSGGLKDETHKRRNRVPISCTICRRRKVKCTKERPVCKGCEKTGVGHLCHYIEPSWAQSTASTGESNAAGDDLSPEEQSLLIGRLKERIRSLEMELSTCNSNGSSPTSLPLSTTASSCSSTSSSNEYQVLSLGKKFDMLHVKATTTVHLGPTSWLAIMKGDPYLRVLWAHIFKMRKQVEDFKFMMRQRQLASQGITTSVSGRCPVSHQATIPDPITASMCPVQHGKRLERPPSVPIAPAPASQPANSEIEYGMKCPVVHSHSKTASSVADSTSGSTGKGCPLMIDGNSYLSDPQKGPSSSKADPKKHQLDGEVKFLQKSTPSPNKRVKTTAAAANSDGDVNIHELFKDDKLKALELLLPSKQVFWLLIERFFEVLYIYMPFLDEAGFKEEIRVIFGTGTGTGTDPGQGGDNTKIKLKVRNPVDYALIGTTCILLRLAWLTLPRNSCNSHLGKNTTTKTYAEDMSKIRLLELPSNEVSLELVRCVKQYMNNNNDNDQLIKKSNLKVVQFAVFLKLFDQYSPEEKDSADGSDSQVFFGMIVHMAIRIGLYRDPDNFENFTIESQRHLWRKLWFGLVSLDVEQSINLGCPRALESYLEFSDTKFPQEAKFSSDLRELTVIKLIKTQYQVDLLLGKAMRVLLNVNKPARKYQIDQLIEELTRHIQAGYDTTSPPPHPDTAAAAANLPQLGTILVNRAKNEPLYSSATRAVQFKLTAQINMFIYLLNYILFVHFEPLGTKDIVFYKLAKTHAQRALDAALEGYRNCTLFFDCNLDYFGPGADLMISPLVLLIGHRSVQFMVSLILRSRCGPYMRPAVACEQPEVKREEADDDANDKEKIFGLNKVNNRNYDLQKVEIRDEQEPAAATTNFYNTDVDSGETLAKILLKHMENFHKLTDKLGGKYPYSWRMSKAVGFFVTLLRKPVNIVKAIVKTDNVKDVENDTGFASNVLNSVPLVLHSDEVGMDLNKSKSKSKSKEEVFEDALEDQKAEPPATNDLLRGIPDFIVPNSQFLFDFNEVSLDQSINEIFNSNSSDPSNLNNNSNNQLNNFDFNFDPMQFATQSQSQQGNGTVSDFTNDLLFGNLMAQQGTNTTTTSFNGESFDPIINNLMTADGSASSFNNNDNINSSNGNFVSYDDGFNAFSGLFN